MKNPHNPSSAQTDLCMLNIGGKERSERLFKELARVSGPEVRGFWQAKGRVLMLLNVVRFEYSIRWYSQ